MDIITDRNNVNSKSDFSLDPCLNTIEKQDVPDFYPEPDFIHIQPQIREFNQTSNDKTEDKSALREMEKDSESITTPHAVADGKLFLNTTSISSCEPVSSSFLRNAVSNLPCSTVTSNNEDDAASAESADVVEDNMKKPLPSQTKKVQRRPGVILLGRGNSFSLGRSEVIFLHNTKPYKRSKGHSTFQKQSSGGVPNVRDKYVDQALNSLTAGNNNMESNAPQTKLSSNFDPSTGTEPNRPSPPPLSNQICVQSGSISVNVANHTNRPIMFTDGKSTKVDSPAGVSSSCHPISAKDSSKTVFETHNNSDGDELAALWAQAELIMAGKQKAVLDVLAQFGVGGSGEDTKDGGEEEEEESVWQVVESKTCAVVR